MKKTITSKDLYSIISTVSNLEKEEVLARQTDEKRLSKEEALLEDIRDLEFHISRFASEGATIRQIKEYDYILDYLKSLYNNHNYYECAITTTSLKMCFGLDITFFTILEDMASIIERKGPITYKEILDNAKKNTNNDDITRR